VDWVQELTEQNIRQAQAMVITTRKVTDDLCEQGSAIRQHSFAVAEATLSNTRDFLQKLSRSKEPRELALIQSEFVSRQAQVLGEGGKELAQTIVQGTGKIVQKASEMTNAEHQRSEAA
jgi:Phasin protein